MCLLIPQYPAAKLLQFFSDYAGIIHDQPCDLSFLNTNESFQLRAIFRKQKKPWNSLVKNIFIKNKQPVPDGSYAACFVHSPRCIVYKRDLYFGAPSTNANFQTWFSTKAELNPYPQYLDIVQTWSSDNRS